MAIPPISISLRKLTRSLRQKKYRDREGLFVIEGSRICLDALQNACRPRYAIVRDNFEDHLGLRAEYQSQGIQVYQAPSTIFNQLCDTQSPQGILAVLPQKQTQLVGDESFIALDGVADPGNLGSILRSAAWFDFPQVILGPGCADLYNSKTLRSTMGALFAINAVQTGSLTDELKGPLKDHTVYGASLQAATSLEEIRPSGLFGIVIGNEARGISPEVSQFIQQQFVIPGGKTESLNAAVAAGISLYHFARYRRG